MSVNAGMARLIVAAVMMASTGAGAFAANDTVSTREISAQRRPQVTIYPRRSYLGPNAKRRCDAWLAKKYRVSGPVVMPEMRCYWR
jgi:hypothetical protein